MMGRVTSMGLPTSGSKHVFLGHDEKRGVIYDYYLSFVSLRQQTGFRIIFAEHAVHSRMR